MESGAEANEAATRTEKGGEQRGRGITAVFGKEVFTFPDAHGAERGGGIGSEGNAERGRLGRGKSEVGRVESGGDEGHPRQGALSQKTAGFVDDKKPAVTHEAVGINSSGGNRATAERFNRVEKKAAEAHARNSARAAKFGNHGLRRVRSPSVFF